jgi:hypothetical protein
MRGVSPRASHEFAEEITSLRALAAWLEDAMQEKVSAWVRSGKPPTPGRPGLGL